MKKRVLFYEPGTENEKLKKFKTSAGNAIFFAIDMNEGTDFGNDHGDQARWQVIVKTPYTDLKDEWVARHRESKDTGQKWYELSALQRII